MGGELPYSALKSGLFVPERRLAALQQAMNVLGEVRHRGGPDVNFSIDAFQLPGMVVGRQQAPILEMNRPRSRMARDQIDHYVLQVLVEGSCYNRDDGNGRFDVAAPGDILVIDCTEPQMTALSPHKGYSLIVSRQALAPLLKSADDHHLSVLRGDQPLPALLRQNIATLHREAGRMTSEEAAAVVNPILSLTASAINTTVSEQQRAAFDQTLLASIRVHIAGRLGEIGLTPAEVASAFGISLRKLTYLFEPLGGFSGYVRQARLRQCRVALSDPAQRDRSIADIARAHGFINATSFSRAFHRTTGMTAREVRAHSARGWPDQPAPPPASSEWWHWIADL